MSMSGLFKCQSAGCLHCKWAVSAAWRGWEVLLAWVGRRERGPGLPGLQGLQKKNSVATRVGGAKLLTPCAWQGARGGSTGQPGSPTSQLCVQRAQRSLSSQLYVLHGENWLAVLFEQGGAVCAVYSWERRRAGLPSCEPATLCECLYH